MADARPLGIYRTRRGDAFTSPSMADAMRIMRARGAHQLARFQSPSEGWRWVYWEASGSQGLPALSGKNAARQNNCS